MAVAPRPPAPPAPPRPPITVRRRTLGASLGSLPAANLVVVEVGLAIALVLLAIDLSLVYVSIAVVVLALLVALLRMRGRWFTQWVKLTVQFSLRGHTRTADPLPAPDEDEVTPDEETVLGAEDSRVNLLRLMVPDLVVAHSVDHERRPVGLAWHQGAWTAVLLVDPAPALVTPVFAPPNLPLGALVPCLEDRGVLLDAIQVIWHCYPGSAALPINSPALASYLEVLGPLPATARRTTWVAVRLDPRRCPAAVQERGGGVVGAHRALIGALSRVSSALEARGVPTRPLDSDELLRSGVSAAELTGVAGSDTPVSLRERWGGVTAAGIGHASYAITKWPSGRSVSSIGALTSVRGLSTTVTMSVSPSDEEDKVGLRGLVRVSARTPGELAEANQRLETVAEKVQVSLTPLRGLQVAGLAATLPLGGAA
jgi:type VII secretion protein EccE